MVPWERFRLLGHSRWLVTSVRRYNDLSERIVMEWFSDRSCLHDPVGELPL